MSLDVAPGNDRILTPDAVAFLAELHGRFGARRSELLQARSERGAPSGFLEETATCARATGRSPPSATTTPTAASRSPARPTASS